MFDKVLEKIFSVKNAEGCNNKVYKVITILGIKLKIKNNKKTFEKQQNILFNQMLEYQKMLITTPYVFQGRNLWEVPFFEKFANKLLNTDYEQDYKSLIKNLDKKSVETVNRILARIIYVKTHDANGYDIFTTEEKEVIRLIPQVFNNNILKLNEHCYAYNHYFLSENHFEVNVFRDKHELESLNINYFKDKNIIDAGGFIGDSAIVLSDYTTKNVYSFEPVKNNYDKMLQTIHLNNKNNIIPIYCGLGEAEYNVNMLGEQGSGCSVDISKKDEDAGVVKVITLDKYVRENNLEVGLIKTDLEGYEQYFLRGAENTIKTQKPTLLISIYHNTDDFFNIKPIIESWNLGYKFRIVKPLDGHILLETLLIAEIEPKAGNK